MALKDDLALADELLFHHLERFLVRGAVLLHLIAVLLRGPAEPGGNGAGRLAQLVRASALQAEGHPFEPDTAHHVHRGGQSSDRPKYRAPAVPAPVLFPFAILPGT